MTNPITAFPLPDDQDYSSVFVEPARLYRRREPTYLEEGSDVVQEYVGEVDINVIVSKYKRTGILPPNPSGVAPIYEDVSPLTGLDYGQQREAAAQAMATINQAQSDWVAAQPAPAPAPASPAPAPSPAPTPPQ